MKCHRPWTAELIIFRSKDVTVALYSDFSGSLELMLTISSLFILVYFGMIILVYLVSKSQNREIPLLHWKSPRWKTESQRKTKAAGTKSATALPLEKGGGVFVTSVSCSTPESSKLNPALQKISTASHLTFSSQEKDDAGAAAEVRTVQSLQGKMTIRKPAGPNWSTGDAFFSSTVWSPSLRDNVTILVTARRVVSDKNLS